MSEAPRLIRARRPNPARAMVSLCAAGLAGLLFLQSSDWLMRSLSWAALALAMILFVRLIIRTFFAPDILLLSEGFKVKGLGTSGLILWTDVARFGQADLRRTSFVIYSLKARPFGGEKRPARLHGLPKEADGYLAQAPEMSVAEQLALMNAWKAKA